MRAITGTVVLCLAALVAQGQEVCRGPKIVKTTGTAELKVTPDQATIQLGVERQSATAKYAKAEVASTSRKDLGSVERVENRRQRHPNRLFISRADDRLSKRPAYHQLHPRNSRYP